MRLLPGLVLLVACGGPSPAEFPVGLFGVETALAARHLSEQGFNAAQSYGARADTLRALATEARRRGMLLMASPRGVISSTAAARQFPGVIWYLQDEPDVQGVTREQLAAIDRAVRAWSPGSRTAFVLGNGGRAKDYPGVADLIMVDWYPVPHLPLESAGDHVRLTRAAAGERKVWAVLQAMDWRDFPQRDRKKPRIGRFPSRAEMRFMSYDAILAGAEGVWFYTYTPAPGRNLTAERLSSIASVARELRAMGAVFARGRPIRLSFDVPSDGWAARVWAYRGRDYLVLLNRTRDRQFKVPAQALDRGWRPLFEARRDPRELLHAAHGAHYLRPYQILVLESRIKPRRLLGL